jgi:hypothetical protein
MNIAKFGKAAFSGVLTFLGSIAVVMVANTGFGDLTDGQWVSAVVLGLASAGGVYGIPYTPASRTPTTP